MTRPPIPWCRTLVPAATLAVTVVLPVGADPAGRHHPQEIRLRGGAGPYTVERWSRDWPDCRYEDGVAEGRVSLVRDGAVDWLRITYGVGGIGPDDNGVSWRFPFKSRDAAELGYTVRFGRDFDWVKGGKMPGLSGGPESVTGGHRADGRNGFSARLMWRANGTGEAYVYHMNQPDKYGESFPFPEGFTFPADQPVHIRMTVVMNAPGKRNGVLRVSASAGPGRERVLIDRKGMEWRAVDSWGVDSICFETFHGGGDASWAPTRPCCADFGNIQVRDGSR